MLASHVPSHVVSEIRIGGRWLSDFMVESAGAIPRDRFAVVTAYPSVATAVRFTRMGIAAYLAKPVSAESLVDAIAGSTGAQCSEAASCAGGPLFDESLAWPTLDRTIWEYLCEVHAAAGSISEAARRLGLDRRSLRRMLAKHPPVR